MAVAVANAGEASCPKIGGDYLQGSPVSDSQTSSCQMVLVPVPVAAVAPMPVAWQTGDASPTSPGTCQDSSPCCYPLVPIVWAQQSPYVDFTGYPQQQLQEVGTLQQQGNSMGVTWEATQGPTCGKQFISSSTARRQRRQRAADRAAGRAKASEARASKTSAVSDASTSDGEESEFSGMGGLELQDLMEDLQADEGARASAIEALRGSVWRLSRDQTGCRVVQLALEVAKISEATSLIEELHGKVEQAIYSPHANYVIQKVIEVMPAPLRRFVPQELSGNASSIVNHRFGCRIFCRLLEHGACDLTSAIVNDCLSNVEDLCRHTFGHYVAKAILEHGNAEQKHIICEALWASPMVGQVARGCVTGLVRNALHRNSSYVMEMALVHGSVEDAGALCRGLLCHVVDLAQSPFGTHVLQVMRRNNEVERVIYAQLEANADFLRQTKYGKKLLEEVGLGLQKACEAYQ